MDKNIELKDLEVLASEYNKDSKNKILANTIKKNGVLACAYNLAEATKLNNVFNVEVKDMVSITNQKQSGRCWMFSGLNVLRQILAKNLGVKDIELSETHLFFFDKLEKANNKLEKTIEYINMPKDSREFRTLFEFNAYADGGYFHQFKDLVKKYGILPQVCSPEAYSSTKSNEMDQVLSNLITKSIYEMYNMNQNGASVAELRKYKEKTLSYVYKVLAMCLGEPVNEFDFDYKKTNEETKEEEVVSIHSTPLEFFNKYIGVELDDYITLVNFPSQDYPFYKLYQNEGACAMSGSNYFVLNLPIDELKDAAIKSLKDNNPLWFACDVSAESFRADGILSTEAYNVEELFGLDLTYDKYESIRFDNTSCNHAMTLTAVNLVNGKPNRWKVHNSWGKDFGKEGHFIMSDSWFDKYVYQVVANKKYLNSKALEALNDKKIILKAWERVA